MEKIEVRHEIAGLSDKDILAIGKAMALSLDPEVSDLVVNTLDKYEDEIIRQQEVIARLRNKNRNYRQGIKALQRAHEATLYKQQLAQEAFENLKEIVEFGGVPVADGPYSPVGYAPAAV